MDINKNFVEKELNPYYIEDYIERYDNNEIARFNMLINKLFCINTNDINKVITKHFWTTIVLPNGYPEIAPKVFDFYNIIPKDKNNRFHINQDNSLCLTHPIKLYQFYNKNTKLKEFVEKLVIPFYYSFFYYKETQKMPYGEYSHGLQGHIEAVKEYFKLDENSDVEKIYSILNNNKYKLMEFMPKCEVYNILKYTCPIKILRLNLNFQERYNNKNSLYNIISKNKKQYKL